MSLRTDLIEALISAKIPSPRMETDIILKNAAPNYPDITPQEELAVQNMLKRRMAHEPLDKIIGKKEFYKSVLRVTSDVLSPRPDTEILVESAIEYISKDAPCRILDIGTGSGCILLSLLKEFPNARGVGIDISEKALEVAKENAKNLALENNVELICAGWNEVILEDKFDIIVSNPPYIPSSEIEGLETEVKKYDPLLALDGGADGLKCYREIAGLAKNWLKSDGTILLEVGYNQAADVQNIFTNQGFSFVKNAKDLSGINRCVILKK